ncbi:MAG: TIGR03790 family protein [Verrucomicrobia bacterium]|nr:TIGR03790 family protein [Verrucomicrobiota bacterium]
MHPLLRFLLPLLAAVGAAGAADNWAERMLIVANKKIAASVNLAHYYADQRAIATNRILLLDCPASFQVTRREFNDTVRDPIDRHLQQQGWLKRDALGQTVRNDCWLLALCFGVPLRIVPDPDLREPGAERLPSQFRRNEAAVDSELARLPSLNAPLEGPLSNPFFKMEFFPACSRQMMMVARLDGPNADIARALVDRALLVERTGLLGRAYFDARGTRDPRLKPADDSIRAAAAAMRKAGIETTLDEREEVFTAAYPMTDVAFYEGWYSETMAGALARPSFRFRPGAIAYHIHSFSAWNLNTNWVGPCLARGAGAGVGYVYEPYLNFVMDPKLFAERLLSGHNFVESAYAATPALSWQQTVVGDPLYRPFPFTAPEQTAKLESLNHPERAWGCLRQANLLAAAGKEPEAIAYLTKQNATLHSPILDEKLGDLFRAFRLSKEAVPAYQRAAAAYEDPYAVVRVALSMADELLKLRRQRDALDVLDQLIRKFAAYEGRRALLRDAVGIAAKLGDDTKLEFYHQQLGPEPEKPPAKK